ncbi:MAG TPA: serine/threonine-protein kinase [Gaiellaceae bacterium]
MPNADTVIAGRYRLQEILGHGGMSEVWRAEDLELGRLVALKLLAPDADRARFEREARAVASLAHPNITQVYDFGEWEGRPYMLLEYLPGGTLENRLANGKPLPDDEASAIAAAVAAGLAHAHTRGVVHRDLKPANVLFDDEGRPKLADFGIARMAAGEGTLTEAGTVLGTAAYISPEQAMGEPATPASDVYSFGVLLYRMVTGKLPFESTNALELVTLHRDRPPPPIESLRKDAPAVLAATATAALAKLPRDRPADGAAILRRLGVPAGSVATAVVPASEDATRVLPVAAAPAYAADDAYPEPPPSRSRAPLIAAALLLLALAGGGLAYALTRDSTPARPDTVGTISTPSTTRHHTTSADTTTTAPSTSTEQTTTAHTTTQATTAPATTRPATTTQPPPTTTTAPPTTTQPPTTTEPPTTTAPTTTAPALGTTTTITAP